MIKHDATAKRFSFRGALATLTLVILSVALYGLIPQQNELNWLAAEDWSHFAGAEQRADGLHIMPTGRVINHRDTSTAQPNPPVNVRGPYLKVSGDFQVTMNLSGVKNHATVQLYGQVPVIYDEWRQERGSIRLEVSNDELKAQVWDGTAATSIDERTFGVNLKDNVKIVLTSKASNIAISVNDIIVGSIPEHDIFSEGTIWFGADAKFGTTGWVLNSLTADRSGKGTVELVESPELAINHNDKTSLQKLSNATPRRLPIGAAVSINSLMTDEQYRDIALGQFGMMTPENSLKPQFIHPQKDLYLFQDADSLVDAAQKNNMIVHGHSLVMGKANPEWMQKTAENERKQVMIEHIKNVVGHYKGKIAQWDVGNEPLSEDDVDYDGALKGLRKQMWLDAMGEQYIDVAFTAAHEADPAAKLYLNDFGIEKDGKRWDALLALLGRLQQRGVPVYGVGFESHVYHEPADTIDPAVLKQHIQTLASMGLASRISEIDVLGDDRGFQAKQYADVLKVCMSEPTCVSYGTWGITDLYGSTTLSDRYPLKLGDSLLWDEQSKPKEALEGLRGVLTQ